jgi:hypothetical protein
MSTPEDREAGLSLSALLQLQGLAGNLPQPVAGSKGCMSGQLVRLGWKVLPMPKFWGERQLTHWDSGGNKAFIDFGHPNEWLIVPPEDSPIRARKVAGKLCAIRAVYRLSMLREDSAQPTSAQPTGEA